MRERIKVPVADIKEIDRQRTDLGNIEELAESIANIGLIQPIVVNQDLRLVAGGRRLNAVRFLKWTEVDVVFRETMDEAELQELELAENVQRKNISWQENCLAIYRIHKLKQKQATKSQGDWGHRETAQLFKVTKTTITNNLILARALEAGDKDVAACLLPTDALRVLLMKKEDECMKVLANRTCTAPSKPVPSSFPDPLGLAAPLPIVESSNPTPLNTGKYFEPPTIPISKNFVRANCLDWFDDRFGDDFECIDAIITDPPYAIDIDYMHQDQGGMANIDRIRATHDADENVDLLTKFIPRAAKNLRPYGFMALWCDVMRWQLLYDVCTSAGLRVQRWPIIWVKDSPCLNQSANKNFTKNYEACLIASKPKGLLARPSPTSVITAPNIDKLSGHPFSKPVAVWDFLIRHLCIANSFIVDPFMGVGSCPVAAIKLGHRIAGCEIEENHHAHCLENVRSAYLELNPETKFI